MISQRRDKNFVLGMSNDKRKTFLTSMNDLSHWNCKVCATSRLIFQFGWKFISEPIIFINYELTHYKLGHSHLTKAKVSSSIRGLDPNSYLIFFASMKMQGNETWTWWRNCHSSQDDRDSLFDDIHHAVINCGRFLDVIWQISPTITRFVRNTGAHCL